MRATARVRAEAGPGGETRLVELCSQAPLLVRSTPGGVYLVAGAAGPLRGDQLELEVVVGAGATLAVRSAAASLVLPGPGPGPSVFAVRAEVAADACLDWWPEPTVSVRGSDHRAITVITLDDGARLRWHEDLVLGRAGETPGDLRTRMDVTRAGVVLLRHEQHYGQGAPGSDGRGGLAGARRIQTTLTVNPPPFFEGPDMTVMDFPAKKGDWGIGPGVNLRLAVAGP